MVRGQLHAPARAALLHPTCWTVRRSRSLPTVALAHPCMRGPSQCHVQHTHECTHQRAHTRVTHTPAHACCNNTQKGPMEDNVGLTAHRRARASGPRQDVVSYMMFPSRGHLPPRSPAAYHLRPRRRPPSSAPLVSRPTAPRPSRALPRWPTRPQPSAPPTTEPRRSLGVWSGGGRGHCPAALPVRRRSAAGRTCGRPCRLRFRVPQIRASRLGPRSSKSSGPVGQQAREPCRPLTVQIGCTCPQGIGHRRPRRIPPICCNHAVQRVSALPAARWSRRSGQPAAPAAQHTCPHARR